MIGWDTFLGLNDDPAILSGHGPIPAAVRDLAEQATWRCAVIDSHHHTLLGLGRATFTPTYRPGDPLTRHLTIRDRTCTFPGCRQPAHRADLDHRIPHPIGVTCECNLAALCRTHHRLKHEAGYTVTAAPGNGSGPPTVTWTTPAGRRYHVPQDPLLPTAPTPAATPTSAPAATPTSAPAATPAPAVTPTPVCAGTPTPAPGATPRTGSPDAPGPTSEEDEPPF